MRVCWFLRIGQIFLLRSKTAVACCVHWSNRVVKLLFVSTVINLAWFYFCQYCVCHRCDRLYWQGDRFVKSSHAHAREGGCPYVLNFNLPSIPTPKFNLTIMTERWLHPLWTPVAKFFLTFAYTSVKIMYVRGGLTNSDWYFGRKQPLRFFWKGTEWTAKNTIWQRFF